MKFDIWSKLVYVYFKYRKRPPTGTDSLLGRTFDKLEDKTVKDILSQLDKRGVSYLTGRDSDNDIIIAINPREEKKLPVDKFIGRYFPTSGFDGYGLYKIQPGWIVKPYEVAQDEPL